MGVPPPKRDRLAGKPGAEWKEPRSGKYHSARTAAYQAAIDSMVDAVILYDANGAPIHINPAAIQLLSFDPSTETGEAELSRLRIYDLTGQAVPFEAVPSTRALRGEWVKDELYRFTDPQGQERLVEVSASPMELEGEQIGAVSIWRDVRERQAIRNEHDQMQALRDAVTRLEYFVNSNMVGIVIGDADGRICEANDYYLNLVRYSREDMEAHNIRWIDLTPPEHLPADRRALAELARRGACEPYEKEYIRKDGSRVWVLVGDTLLPDGQIMAFVLDISARKQAEHKLHDALDRAEEGQRTLETLMRYVPEGIAITGGPPDFRIRIASRYGMEMSGRQKKDLLGMAAGTHIHAWNIYAADGVTRPQPEELPLYRASRFGEEVIGDELVIENVEGRKIPVLVNAAPVRDEQGRIIAAINCWRDITERKEMEEALRSSEAALRSREEMLQHYADELANSNQDLENFAFVASHDLQEPLRKIASFGDILKDRLDGHIDEATQDLLDRMLSASERMKTMINSLLHLSRINTRGQAFVAVDLNEIAAQVISDLEPAIERTGGQVEVGPLPRIEADPLQMSQLLLNLIGNGLKFHKPGEPPHVKVQAEVKNARRAANSLLVLTVTDHGIGFELEYFERILQPFQRLHGRGDFEGTGMGLAICKRIVDRHHGQIRAESTPGEGARFIITLPVKQPA